MLFSCIFLFLPGPLLLGPGICDWAVSDGSVTDGPGNGWAGLGNGWAGPGNGWAGPDNGWAGLGTDGPPHCTGDGSGKEVGAVFSLLSISYKKKQCK